MLTLAIDTSGPVTTLAIASLGEEGLSVQEEGGRRHAEVIDQLFQQLCSDLGDTPESVCVGIGPGPYSGLRVGIAFAIGLGRAWQVPVVGVCSLDAIAWSHAHMHSGEFAVTTDARRREIYWARYNQAGLRIVGPQVTHSKAFDVPVVADQPVDAATMASRVAELLAAGTQPVSLTDEWAPHGTDGSNLAIPPGPLFAPRPLYLRSPDITWSTAGTVTGNR